MYQFLLCFVVSMGLFVQPALGTGAGAPSIVGALKATYANPGLEAASDLFQAAESLLEGSSVSRVNQDYFDLEEELSRFIEKETLLRRFNPGNISHLRAVYEVATVLGLKSTGSIVSSAKATALGALAAISTTVREVRSGLEGGRATVEKVSWGQEVVAVDGFSSKMQAILYKYAPYFRERLVYSNAALQETFVKKLVARELLDACKTINDDKNFHYNRGILQSFRQPILTEGFEFAVTNEQAVRAQKDKARALEFFDTYREKFAGTCALPQPLTDLINKAWMEVKSAQISNPVPFRVRCENQKRIVCEACLKLLSIYQKKYPHAASGRGAVGKALRIASSLTTANEPTLFVEDLYVFMKDKAEQIEPLKLKINALALDAGTTFTLPPLNRESNRTVVQYWYYLKSECDRLERKYEDEKKALWREIESSREITTYIQAFIKEGARDGSEREGVDFNRFTPRSSLKDLRVCRDHISREIEGNIGEYIAHLWKSVNSLIAGKGVEIETKPFERETGENAVAYALRLRTILLRDLPAQLHGKVALKDKIELLKASREEFMRKLRPRLPLALCNGDKRPAGSTDTDYFKHLESFYSRVDGYIRTQRVPLSQKTAEFKKLLNIKPPFASESVEYAENQEVIAGAGAPLGSSWGWGLMQSLASTALRSVTSVATQIYNAGESYYSSWVERDEDVYCRLYDECDSLRSLLQHQEAIKKLLGERYIPLLYEGQSLIGYEDKLDLISNALLPVAHLIKIYTALGLDKKYFTDAPTLNVDTDNLEGELAQYGAGMKALAPVVSRIRELKSVLIGGTDGISDGGSLQDYCDALEHVCNEQGWQAPSPSLSSQVDGMSEPLDDDFGSMGGAGGPGLVSPHTPYSIAPSTTLVPVDAISSTSVSPENTSAGGDSSPDDSAHSPSETVVAEPEVDADRDQLFPVIEELPPVAPASAPETPQRPTVLLLEDGPASGDDASPVLVTSETLPEAPHSIAPSTTLVPVDAISSTSVSPENTSAGGDSSPDDSAHSPSETVVAESEVDADRDQLSPVIEELPSVAPAPETPQRPTVLLLEDGPASGDNASPVLVTSETLPEAPPVARQNMPEFAPIAPIDQPDRITPAPAPSPHRRTLPLGHEVDEEDDEVLSILSGHDDSLPGTPAVDVMRLPVPDSPWDDSEEGSSVADRASLSLAVSPTPVAPPQPVTPGPVVDRVSPVSSESSVSGLDSPLPPFPEPAPVAAPVADLEDDILPLTDIFGDNTLEIEESPQPPATLRPQPPVVVSPTSMPGLLLGLVPGEEPLRPSPTPGPVVTSKKSAIGTGVGAATILSSLSYLMVQSLRTKEQRYLIGIAFKKLLGKRVPKLTTLQDKKVKRLQYEIVATLGGALAGAAVVGGAGIYSRRAVRPCRVS